MKKKRRYDTPLQGRLQSQIAKGKWAGSLKDIKDMPSPRFEPPRSPEPTDAELSSMSESMLKELSDWAIRQYLPGLYGRVQVAMRNRFYNQNTQNTISPAVTSGATGAYSFTIQTVAYPPEPPKPTQKVGDWVKLKTDQTFNGITLSKDTVVQVVKVGSRWVYALPEVLGSGNFKLNPASLETVEKPIPKELDLSRVVMPEDHREAIKEAVAQLEHNDKIFQDWGFDDILEKGKAISMLFFGPPGTGKTMCAEIIAKTLGKKLEIIGTAEIQSSEPGQAERNIKAYFEKSDKDTMLLFDECDSLVHSRNNTGSIMAAQINSLLTALERYEGIVIFTTNRLGVLDEAFNRRLSLKLHFPMPSKEQRLQIWKGMFPEKAPLDKNIKWDKLAALELTGGYIKNIVLRAARSAATQGLDTITYEVLKNAAIHEEMSKREFEEAARHHRRGGVTTVDEAVQDFGQDNRLEIKNGPARTSPRAGKNQKK